MTETLIDDETVQSGGTASGTVTRPENEHSTDFAFYLKGDSDSADVTVEFRLHPAESAAVDPSNGYQATVEDEKNVDITDGEVYHPETRGAGTVEVRVTNNGNNATNLSVRSDEYQK